jgi:hypothetical protein
MRINVMVQLYLTVLRGGQEYPISPALPWQPGESETLILRARNNHPTRLDFVGAITLAGNGHVLDPAVTVGEGVLDGDGRFVGPTQDQVAPTPAGVAGADLVYNVRIPWGKYVELRVSVTWGNTDVSPMATTGPEVAGAPGYRVAPTVIAAGIAPLGAVPPTAPAGTP